MASLAATWGLYIYIFLNIQNQSAQGNVIKLNKKKETLVTPPNSLQKTFVHFLLELSGSDCSCHAKMTPRINTLQVPLYKFINMCKNVNVQFNNNCIKCDY